jgi:large subunit ribosomal protein L10
LNIKELAVKDFDGQTAAVFGYDDEVSPAKIVAQFKKAQGKEKENSVFFLGGILDGRFISATEVTALAQVPSRHELYAQMVGSFNAPISGFVNALAGNLKNLVYVLSAIKDKK